MRGGGDAVSGRGDEAQDLDQLQLQQSAEEEPEGSTAKAMSDDSGSEKGELVSIEIDDQTLLFQQSQS